MAENSILPNANNIVIAGSSFQTGNNTFNYQTPETRTPAKGLGLLFEKSALGARVDSKARYDAPKCDEGTREAIIQRIMGWVESNEDRASALWLHGSAGSGKSALARAIAELCTAKKSLLATFFFNRTRTIRVTDGDYLIPTLALQLTEKMRVPRTYIKKYLRQQPGIFDRTREEQMQELIINPLSTYFSLLEYHYRRLIQKAPPRLIIIDGLDECFGKDIQCDLLRVLGKAIEKLRLPLRFLIASRPEPQIRDSFNDNGVFQVNRFITLNLNDDPNAAHDIRTYLEVQFTKIRNTHKIRSQIPALWPLAEDIMTLIGRASGQFIFISTVVGYVGHPKHNPVTRLRIITNRLQPPAADAPYGQLDLLYQLIFSSAEESGTDINKVLQILAILYIARPEVALGDPYTYAAIGRVLDTTPGDVFLLLDEFASLIEVPPPDSTHPIKILHASLADFLLDSSRSGRFNIDMRRIHGVLALYYSKYIPTRITKMTSSTHRDDLKHHFLPFIAHWKNADIPANDVHLCDTMSLISEAMIFLCQCTKPCADILRTACCELPLSTCSRPSDWIEQFINELPLSVGPARPRQVPTIGVVRGDDKNADVNSEGTESVSGPTGPTVATRSLCEEDAASIIESFHTALESLETQSTSIENLRATTLALRSRCLHLEWQVASLSETVANHLDQHPPAPRTFFVTGGNFTQVFPQPAPCPGGLEETDSDSVHSGTTGSITVSLSVAVSRAEDDRSSTRNFRFSFRDFEESVLNPDIDDPGVDSDVGELGDRNTLPNDDQSAIGESIELAATDSENRSPGIDDRLRAELLAITGRHEHLQWRVDILTNLVAEGIIQSTTPFAASNMAFNISGGNFTQVFASHANVENIDI